MTIEEIITKIEHTLTERRQAAKEAARDGRLR